MILSNVKVREVRSTDASAKEIKVILAEGIFKYNGYIGRLLDRDLKTNIFYEGPFTYADVVIRDNPEAEEGIGNLGQIKPEGRSLGVIMYKHPEELSRLSEKILSNNRVVLSLTCQCFHFHSWAYVIHNVLMDIDSSYIEFEVGKQPLTLSGNDIEEYLRSSRQS
jgi:hypothetical protein